MIKSSLLVAESKKSLIKKQTLFTIIAIITGIALPQVFHLLGRATGLGTALGKSILPMHLPVILAGFIAGPVVGFITGTLTPLISFGLTGMPVAHALPFMMVEVGVYGLVAGLLSNSKLDKIPTIVKLLIVQIAGRVVRLLVSLLVVKVFHAEGFKVFAIFKSISDGIIGLAIQWVTIPFIVYMINKSLKKKEN